MTSLFQYDHVINIYYETVAVVSTSASYFGVLASNLGLEIGYPG
jgi:hypothetical protein